MSTTTCKRAARVAGGDLLEEGAELLGAVAAALGVGLGHPAGGHLQGGEQRGGAVPDVVEAGRLQVPGPHRQGRGSPLQRLDGRLLGDAEHHRLLRWMQVQGRRRRGPWPPGPGRRRTGRLRPPRLHAEAMSDPRHRGVRDRCLLGRQRGGQQSRGQGTPPGAPRRRRCERAASAARPGPAGAAESPRRPRGWADVSVYFATTSGSGTRSPVSPPRPTRASRHHPARRCRTGVQPGTSPTTDLAPPPIQWAHVRHRRVIAPALAGSSTARC